MEFFLAIFSAEAVIEIEPTENQENSFRWLDKKHFKNLETLLKKWNKYYFFLFFCVILPIEFFLAISSAEDVFLCSIRRLGILKGGTCMLSVLHWCLKGRRISASNCNLFLWFLKLIILIVIKNFRGLSKNTLRYQTVAFLTKDLNFQAKKKN